MKRLFGQKKPEAPAPTLNDASANLTQRGDVIDAKIKKLDDELMKLRDQISKTRGPGQQRFKQRALQILQQKRTYEKQREMTYQQQFSVDQLAFTQDMMKDTAIQVQAMKEAGKSLKATFKNFSVSEVENMQDDLRDLYEDVQEIQEVMGRAYDVPEELDEDDLNAELDCLAFDMEKEKDASYLDEALATPGTALPATVRPVAEPANTEKLVTDPHSLEAQLGL